MSDTPRKIKVFSIDDSALVRKFLRDIMEADDTLELVGTAVDPVIAEGRIRNLNPDVITVDIEMPRMDGITFIRKLMKDDPRPVVVISSHAQEGSAKVFEALEAGAIEVMAKPGDTFAVADMGPALIQKIRSAASARIKRASRPIETRVPPPALIRPVNRLRRDNGQIILMGASTGGTEALSYIIKNLPAGLPPICIVQHIPAPYSRAFAERLNKSSSLEVREAVGGEILEPGKVFIAPGDFHMIVEPSGDSYGISLHQGPKIHFQRPSVDVLFHSISPLLAPRCLTIVLTGMGKDGADGALRLRQMGSHVIAQSEATCVVYGMPHAVVSLGAHNEIVDLPDIPGRIISWCTQDTPA